MKKERLKRIARRITAFAAAAAMAATFTFPTEIGEGFFDGFGNAIVASAETATGDFTVTGGTLDRDYTYADSVLTIKTGTPVTIKNTNPSTPTTDRIEVESSMPHITLAGVNIDVSALENTAAFKNNSVLEITLAEHSVNKLKSGSNCAGLQMMTKNNRLHIKGEGELIATGGDNGAGIGGGDYGSCSGINIHGGTVIATGSGGGAGIGGGYNYSGSHIDITGGTVTATGGSNGGAGIGGGYQDAGSGILIKGGTVTATGSGGGAGIGGGYGGSGSNITISGGSVKAAAGENANAIGGGLGQDAVIPTNGTDNVYLFTIANPDSAAVLIDGKAYTPVNHKAADSEDGNLYAYLPAKTANDPNEVTVGTKTTKYIYDTNNAKWLELTDAPAADTTIFTYTGSEQTYNIAESEYYTVSGNKQTDAGTYTVTVYLKDKVNTVWNNGSKDDIKFDFVIHKAVPVVDAPTATAIRYGEALSASTLTTGWTWADNTIKPDINNSGYAAYKIVTDYANYDYGNLTGYTYDATNHKLSCTVAVTVNKGIPTVTAPTASAITFGQTLAESALSDTTWSWSDSSTKPTSAGTHSYTAVKTVSDADKYDYTALSGFTFNSSTNTLSTNVSVVVNRVGASVTPPTASNTLTYGQTLANAGLTAGWTWENASTVPDVNNAGFTAYKIVTDYDNFDYSNLTGFVYDETAHKLSYKVAVTVNKATPTDATTASQSFTKGTASTAFAAPVFKGIDGKELTGSVSYTYGGQTYTTTATLTAVLDSLDGGASGTISYTFTPTSANYTTASGSISFSVIDAVDYTITADSHVTVQSTAQAGDIVSVTVEDGYKATVTNSLGTVITTITGTGSFVMPESNVTITSELINTHVHDYSTEWKTDSTSHWYECECGDRVNVAAHVSNGGIVTVRPTETTEGVRTYSCSICGYVMRTEPIPTLDPDHSHSYDTQWKSDSTSHWHECDCGDKADISNHISDGGVVTVAPTETGTGIMTYSCSICGYILRTETIPANTPVHTHNYGTAWDYDSTCHWHECSCGDRSNIGQHISNGGIVTVQPTATSTGLRVYSCSVCGYVLRTETIPATGYNYPNYPTYPTYPTYPFDSSIFNVVTFTDKVNVTAETNENTITLKWDKVEKADKYYVYQYKNGKYVKVKTTSDTSVTFKKLKNGETYKFLIRYTKSGRLSPTKYSGTISVKIYYKPIPKPTASKNSIKLTWEAVPEAEKYAVYKYVDGKVVKLTETKKLSVKIGKLIPDTEYKYIVRAYVDGKWTTMLKSDIVTVKTTAE